MWVPGEVRPGLDTLFPAYTGADKARGKSSKSAGHSDPSQWTARDRPTSGQAAGRGRGRAARRAAGSGPGSAAGQQLAREGRDRYVARGAPARQQSLGTPILGPAPAGSTLQLASGRAEGAPSGLQTPGDAREAPWSAAAPGAPAPRGLQTTPAPARVESGAVGTPRSRRRPCYRLSTSAFSSSKFG